MKIKVVYTEIYVISKYLSLEHYYIKFIYSNIQFYLKDFYNYPYSYDISQKTPNT